MIHKLGNSAEQSLLEIQSTLFAQKQRTNMATAKNTGVPRLFKVLCLGLAGGLVYNTAYNVPGGHRAVIFNTISGDIKGPISEGIHFKMPFIEKPILFDIKAQPFSQQLSLKERRDDEIEFGVRIIARLSTDVLPTTYRKYGPEALKRIVPALTNEACKIATEGKTYYQLLTDRDDIRKEIQESLSRRGREFGIDILDVSIVRSFLLN